MRTPNLPSGEQWTIRHGDQELTLVEVGGGIRSYSRGGRDVIAGYAADDQCSAGRGQLLMPWPNRIRDGRFTFGGRSFQLALTEPARHNATHGLVRWDLWAVEQRADDRIVLGSRLRPQQGWAWFLDLRVTYVLDDDGLTVTPQATNVGTTALPFGFGAHPYLTLGEESVDELDLELPAVTALVVDTERLLPVATEPVDGADRDFRTPRTLRGVALDTAFTDLQAGIDGRWRVALTRPGSAGEVALWGEAAAYPWLQVFTGDSLPAGQARTTGVAVEPMTCPPDAFNSGDCLIILEPGQGFSGSWGITSRRAF